MRYRSDPFGLRLLPNAGEAHKIIGRLSPLKTKFRPRLEVYSLGRPRILWNGSELCPAAFKGKKNFYFLVYIVSSTNSRVSMEQSMDQFWEGKSKSNLYSACSRIKKVLDGVSEGHALLSEASGISLHPSISVRHDLDKVRLFKKSLANPLVAKSEILFLAKELTRLFRGPYLDGCHDDWAIYIREFVRTSMLEGLDRALALVRPDGSPSEIRLFADKILELEPFHLTAIRCLVELFVRSGDKIQACRLLERYKAGIRDEFGLEADQDLHSLWSLVRDDAT